MTSDQYDPKTVGIVRSFSGQLAETMPENILGQAVAAHETSLQAGEARPAQWRDWLRFDGMEV